MHKQKLPTTSTIPELLVSVAASMIFWSWVVRSGSYIYLGADGNDVLRVILHRARRFWAKAPMEAKNQGAIDDEFQMPHRALLSGLVFEVDTGHRARPEWMIFREMAKPIRKIEAVELFLFLEVVAGVLFGCIQVRDRHRTVKCTR